MDKSAPYFTLDYINSLIVEANYHVFADTAMTICTLRLKNGFTVVGESAPVSPEIFNEEISRNLAWIAARNKIWNLEGYVLKNQKALVDRSPALPKNDRLFELGQPKTYIGTKVINTIPFTRGGYSSLRGWSIPADENANDPGYLLEYADGGAPNVEGFSGYVSWSPKDIFERSYQVYGMPQETTFLDRLLQEQRELHAKIKKLAVFLVSKKFKELSKVQQALLVQQKDCMAKYLGILDNRVADLRRTKS